MTFSAVSNGGSPRRWRNGIVAALLVALAGARGHACSCASASVAEYFANAHVVFAGRTLAVGRRPVEDDSWSDYETVATIAVSKLWKGPDGAARLIVSTSIREASCGYGFRPGRQYVVFARWPAGEPQTTLYTSLCAGNRSYPGEKGVLQELDRLAETESAERSSATDPD